MSRSLIIIIVSAVILVAFLGLNFALKPPAVGVDNCRLDGVIPAHTIVVIDQSDRFEQNDADWVVELIRRETISLRSEGRLTIYSVVDNAERPIDMLFQRCTPGAPNALTGLYQNRQIREQAFQEQFKSSLDGGIREAIQNDRADSSPLFETFEQLLRRPDFAPNIDNRRLIIVSDMIQNSPRYSFYRQPADWDLFAEAVGYAGSERFEGVNIIAHQANRDRGPGRDELRAFWEEYFVAVGGGELSFVTAF